MKWCQGLACKTAHLSALISAVLNSQKNKSDGRKRRISPRHFLTGSRSSSSSPPHLQWRGTVRQTDWTMLLMCVSTLGRPNCCSEASEGKVGAIASRASFKMTVACDANRSYSRGMGCGVAVLSLSVLICMDTKCPRRHGGCSHRRQTQKAIWLQISHSCKKKRKKKAFRSVRQDKAN